MREEHAYEGAMRENMDQIPSTLKKRRELYPQREELHGHL
jgi:hypothetical protein